MSDLVLGMGIIATVLLVSALASGLVERAPLSFPMIFLALGFILGGGGLGVIQMRATDPILEAVGVVTLALVLFLDAVDVQLDELRQDWFVPFLTLGPGTVIAVAGISLGAYLLLGLTPMQALLIGAVLGSTDAVLLRDIVRDERVPRSMRRALSVEAGMNDVILLPIVLILIAILTEHAGSAGDWVGFLIRVLILSPLVGLAVGGIGANLMGRADAHFNIRKEYQALYGIGLVLAAYFAGQAVNGTGLLAAFFGGLAITMFNVSLCECFMEYGEVTAEMMMLLAFVLFGAVLSELLGTINLLPPFILAVLTIAVVRPAALLLILQKAKMSKTARIFMGWFGPRGLSGLLMALLVVQAGVPDAERLMAITGVVVVVSVIVHGASATPLAAWYGHKVVTSVQTLQEERESTFTGLFEDDPDNITFVTPDELAAQMADDQPPLVLDVRARNHYETDEGRIAGSIRVLPDLIGDWALNAPKDRPIVAYCSCPNDATSIRVARQLQTEGFQAAALKGGYPAWAAQYPVEPKSALINPGMIPSEALI